jgi:septum formation protein
MTGVSELWAGAGANARSPMKWAFPSLVKGVGLCYTPPVPAACVRVHAEAGPTPAEGVQRVVLASTSPRRRELLEQVGLSFEIVPPDAEAEAGLHAGRNLSETRQAVEAAARAKAASVAARMVPGTLVVAADTVVVLGRKMLGKPRDSERAARMLRHLSGRLHRVLTAVAVHRAGEETGLSACEETRVRFRPLSEEEIAAYVSSGEPLDKAGAYGIQGLGALLVERLEGCYFNVVGLPLVALHRLLRASGVDLLAAPEDLPRPERAGSRKPGPDMEGGRCAW